MSINIYQTFFFSIHISYFVLVRDLELGVRLFDCNVRVKFGCEKDQKPSKNWEIQTIPAIQDIV